MDKIEFPVDGLSFQKFQGEGLIDDDYEIKSPDFSLVSNLNYQKMEQGCERRICKRFQVKVHTCISFDQICPQSADMPHG